MRYQAKPSSLSSARILAGMRNHRQRRDEKAPEFPDGKTQNGLQEREILSGSPLSFCENPTAELLQLNVDAFGNGLAGTAISIGQLQGQCATLCRRSG